MRQRHGKHGKAGSINCIDSGGHIDELNIVRKVEAGDLAHHLDKTLYVSGTHNTQTLSATGQRGTSKQPREPIAMVTMHVGYENGPQSLQ
jgi:hypothetical protein